jgi:hypothetical protein
MTTKTNKILSAAVAIAIIVSIAVLVYVNLPKQTSTLPEDNPDHKTSPSIFSLIFDDKQTNYTMNDLVKLEKYTGKGGYLAQSGFIKGVGNYTGVNISTLVSTFQPAPHQYNIMVIASDGNLTYNYSIILGNVDVYNVSDQSPMGKSNMTMVLVYKYEGNWLNESSDGKLKIAFLDEKGSITKASLWWKKVISIRILTE